MISIRKATGDDIAAISSVQKTTWLATYPNESIGITRADIEEKFIQNNVVWDFSDVRFSTWVAEANGNIVGYCVAQKEQTQNRLKALYVLPLYQKRGIGKKLMTETLSWLREGKIICLNVASYNKKAIRFYGSFGFIPTGNMVSDPVAKLPSQKNIPEIEMARAKKI